MNSDSEIYLAEWLYLAATNEAGIALWFDAFDDTRVSWRLTQARRLLRGIRQLTLSAADRARVHHYEGMLEAQLGDWNRATERFKRALDLLEGSQEVEDGVLILNDLGMVLRLQGNAEDAREAHEQALALARVVENPHLVAESLSHVGLDLEHQKLTDQAVGYFRQALSASEALGDHQQAAFMLNHLGEALWRTGRLIEARNALTGALDLLASVADDPYLHAQVEGNLGNVAYEEGDLDMAAALWQSALNSMDQLDVVFDKIGLLNNLGGLAYAQADYGRALAFFQESLELAQELGDERGIQEALRNLILAIGRHDEVVGSEQLCAGRR
ncbi:MAG: tetratricopeptide repeat protein [Anaerolineae bacterium]